MHPQEVRVQVLHELVGQQASLNPDLPAAFDQINSLSYSELIARASAVAHKLLQQGVQPNTLVGLCVGRSIEMIVALLGILNAGAAFLPLDPAYPPDRLKYMVADAAVKVIIADRSTIARLPDYDGQVLILEDIAAEDLPTTAPQVSIAPNDLAYAIYTSGSTGRPKGVMIEHRNIVSFIEWTRDFFRPEQTRRMLCANSLSFDVSVFEIFAALASGGALIVVQNILDLLTAPPREEISMLLAAPSSLTEIIRARAVPPSVNTIIVGGEKLSTQLAREIYETTRIAVLLNTWGVTEDTICTTTYVVPRKPTQDPPIGIAITGRAIHVLDEHQQPVPPGVPGEMYCSGAGVGRGYLNQPERNAQRFLPNPYGDSPLLYRTGDLAVLNDAGEICFIGRDDQQVKVQGMRIELGEIESVLQHFPGIAQAAVVVRPQSTILDLYAVETSPGMLALSEIQAFVAERLPAHMVPDTLTVVPAMPIAPTGKLDRKALQNLGGERKRFANTYIEPVGDYEIQIARLFEQLLGLEQVGARDSFFALAGKSLLAARLAPESPPIFGADIERLEAENGKDLLPAAFAFEPTVRYLAAVLQGHEKLPLGKKVLRCMQSGSAEKTPLFIFHGVITGEAFYSYNLMHALGPKQPLYTLAPHGVDGLEVPETIEEMAADYLAQIREVQPKGPYQFIGYCNGGLVAYEVARTLEAAGEEVSALVLIASPGHNIRFGRLKRIFDRMAWLPGWDEKIRRTNFLRSRERLRLLKYQAEYGVKLARMVASRKPATIETPTERFRRARRLGNQSQRNDRRFYGIIQAIDMYVPGPYHGKICLIWGRDDEYLKSHDPHRDWASIAPQVHYQLVDGGHTFLDSNPELVLEHFPHTE